MATTNQKLQMKDWKRINREEYLQYCKNYYKKHKHTGKWNAPIVEEEDRKIRRGRVTKKTIALAASKGWRDIKGLERYKFPKIKPINALPAERGWIAGRPPGVGNRPKCMIMGCEKKTGSFTVLFS